MFDENLRHDKFPLIMSKKPVVELYEEPIKGQTRTHKKNCSAKQIYSKAKYIEPYFSYHEKNNHSVGYQSRKGFDCL